jgi:hypothetical protein
MRFRYLGFHGYALTVQCPRKKREESLSLSLSLSLSPSLSLPLSLSAHRSMAGIEGMTEFSYNPFLRRDADVEEVYYQLSSASVKF